MNVGLIIYKITGIVLFLVFGFFVSDVNRKNAKPLIKQPWLTLMRLFFPVAPLCYAYYLYKLDTLFISDLLAMVIMFVGTIMVVLSKLKLGTSHSWAGYAKQGVTDFQRTGIYSYIRHPLYTGIYIAVTGTAVVVIPRASFTSVLFYVYIIGTILSFVYLYISSRRESIALTERFGEAYAQYEKEVPAFLPRLFFAKRKELDTTPE
jgi:protein-S-isoprenylcysteine O-methyltransferase Ste14